MKRLILHTVFLSLAVVFTAACAGSNPNNNGYTTCQPGQVCVNGLPPGTVVQYSGTLSNVQDSQAFYLAQAINGNATNTGINFSNGSLSITAQGLQNGGTNYFVVFQIRPQPTNWWVSTCITYGYPNSCYNPIVISGNAAYSNNGTQHIFQVVYSPGIKLNIVVNSGTADNPLNGTQTSLSNVVINLVKNGQDPVFGGDLLANANLYRY